MKSLCFVIKITQRRIPLIMNKKVNTILIARDKFMPELHLRLIYIPRFTYTACGPFT